jgi:hypothetical protein
MEKSSHIAGPFKEKYFVRVEVQWVRPRQQPAWISATADIFLGIPTTGGSTFVERVVSAGPHPNMFSAQQKAETAAKKKIEKMT